MLQTLHLNRLKLFNFLLNLQDIILRQGNQGWNFTANKLLKSHTSLHALIEMLYGFVSINFPARLFSPSYCWEETVHLLTPWASCTSGNLLSLSPLHKAGGSRIKNKYTSGWRVCKATEEARTSLFPPKEEKLECSLLVTCTRGSVFCSVVF